MQRPRPRLKNQWDYFVYDCLTTAAGTYDPARAIGYIGSILVGAVFLGLAIYDTVNNGKLDYMGFAAASAGVATTVFGAAAGVWAKKDVELNKDAKIYLDDNPDATQTGKE